jgi:hypothetical protein
MDMFLLRLYSLATAFLLASYWRPTRLLPCKYAKTRGFQHISCGDTFSQPAQPLSTAKLIFPPTPVFGS